MAPVKHIGIGSPRLAAWKGFLSGMWTAPASIIEEGLGAGKVLMYCVGGLSPL